MFDEKIGLSPGQMKKIVRPLQFFLNITIIIIMTTSFNAPLSGLAAAALSQDITANNIANISTPGYKEKRAIQSESAISGTLISSVQTTDKEPDLSKSMVDLSINKNTYSANLKMIKAQDRMLGTLLDIIR